MWLQVWAFVVILLQKWTKHWHWLGFYFCGFAHVDPKKTSNFLPVFENVVFGHFKLCEQHIIPRWLCRTCCGSCYHLISNVHELTCLHQKNEPNARDKLKCKYCVCVDRHHTLTHRICSNYIKLIQSLKTCMCAVLPLLEIKLPSALILKVSKMMQTTRCALIWKRVCVCVVFVSIVLVFIHIKHLPTL